MHTKPRVWIPKSWSGGHRLIITRDKFGSSKIDVLRDFVWDEIDEGGFIDHMQGVGQADELIQAIVDRAWEAGFRPSGFSDVKNETAALRDHLADMKTIAFHQLQIKRTAP